MPETRRPNILLITADQMRCDCLGATGHPVVRTPHLDALAARGVRFTNAYTTFPVCVPARLSILTGQYPHAHGTMGNRSMVPTSQPNIASLLRDAGYRTAAIGKMHFWPPYAEFGFEHMRLAEQDGPGWKVDDYHATYLAERGMVDIWDYWDQHKPYRAQAPQEYWDSFGARGSEIPEEHYHTTWIANETIDYIRRSSDRPFFIWTSFIKPHHPFDPPKPWDTLYDPASIPPLQDQALALAKPLMTNGGQRDPRDAYFDLRKLTDGAYRKVAAHYYGAISHIDHHVGRILQALEERGELERTLIIFTSDHGDYMGDYGLILKSPGIPYDSLAKVPFIVAGPGCRRGETSDALVSLVDILPTAAAHAGVEVPDFVQGADLSPLLRSSAASSPWREAVFCEARGIKAVRTRTYKYLYNHSLQIEELYDVSADPGELRNLADEPRYAGVKREMRERLLGWLIETEWERNRVEWDYRSLKAR